MQNDTENNPHSMAVENEVPPYELWLYAGFVYYLEPLQTFVISVDENNAITIRAVCDKCGEGKPKHEN